MENLLNSLAKSRWNVRAFYAAVVLFFFVMIFLPAVFIIARTPQFSFSPQMQDALLVSFEIALLATFIDVIFGVPVAWLTVRHKFRGREFINTLVDMPLIVPTSALGFSVGLFWGAEGLGLVRAGFWQILALHVAITYPYVVRTVAASLRELDINYEIAARSLGANPLTMFRTVSLPLVQAGLMIGALLSFTRSLGETGATMVVAGAVHSGPTLVLAYKNAGDMGSAVGLSLILIVSSTILLTFAKFWARRRRVKIGKIYPSFEKFLSGQAAYEKALAVGFLIFIIIIPSFFFVKHLGLNADVGLILNSVLISLAIALAVTAVNLIFAVPMAIFIGRNKRIGGLFDFLSDVILVMPTVALGISLALFWGKTDEILVIALAHLSFTYPYILKPVAESVASVDVSLEEAARSLGATSIKAFRTITLPLIMPSITAGALMAFMRSLSETGTTMAISQEVKTIPVLIVDFVKQGKVEDAALACGILFIISFGVIWMLRRTSTSANRKSGGS
ncbi:MAG: ABC transporter permease subunit [Candidatus Micrarchaeota archaeon]